MTFAQILNSLQTTASDYLKQHNLDEFRKITNNQIIYYFDSYDVIKMIEGLTGYERDSFLKPRNHFFDNPENLVRALAYFGWLDCDRIGLLPGHLEEVYRKIQSKITISENNFDKTFIRKTFDAVGLKEFKSNDFNEKELEEALLKLRHQSMYLFQFNFLLDRPNWLDRADYLFRKILDFDNKDAQEAAFTNKKEFKAIYKYFSEERPSKTMRRNNFRDAHSLYLIYKMLKSFEKGDREELPIYFASTQVIKDIKENKEICDLFTTKITVENADGTKINEKDFLILQDSQFILLDTLFKTVRKENEPLYHQFRAYNRLEVKEQVNIEDTERLIFSDTLENVEFQFFEKFWFEKRGHKKISETIKNFVKFDKLTDDDSVEQIKLQRRVQKKEILSRLNENATYLDLMSKAWEASDDFVEKKKHLDVVNPFTEFGLTRFSFTDDEEIKTYFTETVFVSINEEERLLDFQGQFISTIFRVLKGDSAKEELEKIMAALWIYKEFKLITRILDHLKGDSGNNIALPLIHAASLLKPMLVNKDKLMKLIRQIECTDYNEKPYKKQIGLGYIYFNLWDELNDGFPMTPEGDMTVIIKHKGFFNKAQTLLKEGVLWLFNEKDKVEHKKGYRNKRYLYALNNYIYYTTRAADANSFKGLSKYFNRFLRSKAKFVGDNEFWQFRFEDTIALYYLRKAQLSHLAKKEHISHGEKAKEHIKTAIKNAVNDIEKFKHTEEYITTKLNELNTGVKTLEKEGKQKRTAK